MEQIKLVLFDHQDLNISDVKNKITQPKSCQSCGKFINLGWEKDPKHQLNSVLKMECETMIGICELKEEKVFGTQICKKFKLHQMFEGKALLEDINNRSD